MTPANRKEHGAYGRVVRPQESLDLADNIGPDGVSILYIQTAPEGEIRQHCLNLAMMLRDSLRGRFDQEEMTKTLRRFHRETVLADPLTVGLRYPGTNGEPG